MSEEFICSTIGGVIGEITVLKRKNSVQQNIGENGSEKGLKDEIT